MFSPGKYTSKLLIIPVIGICQLHNSDTGACAHAVSSAFPLKLHNGTRLIHLVRIREVSGLEGLTSVLKDSIITVRMRGLVSLHIFISYIGGIVREETRYCHTGYSFRLTGGFFYMHHPTDRIAHTMAFDTPVMEHWFE